MSYFQKKLSMLAKLFSQTLLSLGQFYLYY